MHSLWLPAQGQRPIVFATKGSRQARQETFYCGIQVNPNFSRIV